MTGQEHQQSDMNLLFPIAKPTEDAHTADNATATADHTGNQGGQRELGEQSANLSESTSHASSSAASQSPTVAGMDAPGSVAADASRTSAIQGNMTGSLPASAEDDGVLPGDIVDTNWDIPLITFPSFSNDGEGEVSPISAIAGISSDSPRTGNSTGTGNSTDVASVTSAATIADVASGAAASTQITPSSTAIGTPQHRAGTKTEAWLNAARQDKDQSETQQFGSAMMPSNVGTQAVSSNPVSATEIIQQPQISRPTTSIPSTSTVATGPEFQQNSAQRMGMKQENSSLLTPPAPSPDDIARERVANAETVTMTPVSSAAVVAGTAAINAKVTAPGAAKTTATRTIHTPESDLTGPQDAVGSLQEELVDKSSQQTSVGYHHHDEEASDSEPSRGSKTRSRVIVVIFLIITIVAAGVGVYYLSGMVRTNRNRSNAYSNCTKAYSQVKENAETLETTLKTTAAQQKIGTDQVADVMTVEKLKTAVSKAKALDEPAVCKTSMSTSALNKTAETNQALATQLVNANATVKAAANDVKTSAKTKKTNDYNTAVDTLKTTTSEATTLLSNSQGVVADDNTRTTLQSAVDAANALLQKNKPALADVQKAQTDLQTASDAVNDSMEAYKTQRAAADAAAAASAAAAAQAQNQAQGQTQQPTQSQSGQPNPTQSPTTQSPASQPSEDTPSSGQTPSATATGNTK
ncbi:FIVAR domain-containing protein [Bifidobacterium apri]|uniref:Sugar-binding protein n=1 Tax=Bifidobacterium apri TaxID=1769423 RepID=A0A6A2W191_9BIFI|nr:FIVAR domain-containing protein [Bifidobacterium apri]KAB8297482.1 hypothetical protein DSM100238_1267 [Bifidobacterium apri]